MAVILTNGATTLTYRNGDFQLPRVPFKDPRQRILRSSAVDRVLEVSDVPQQDITAQALLHGTSFGSSPAYSTYDDLVNFYEDDGTGNLGSVPGVNASGRGFLLKDADGDEFFCRFARRPELEEVKKNVLYAGPIDLIIIPSLPTHGFMSTGLQGWWAAWDMDGDKTFNSQWSSASAVGGSGTEWGDRSGNGIDGIQLTAAQQPTYNTGQIGNNSRPAVRFNTSPAQENLAVNGIAPAIDGTDTPYSVYMVLKVNASLSGSLPPFSATNSGSTAVLDPVVVRDGTKDFSSKKVDDSTASAEPTGGAYANTTSYVISAISSGTVVNLYKDGTIQIDAGAQDLGATTLNQAHIGNTLPNGTPGAGWNGDLAELVIFNVEHNRTQQRLMEQRLADMAGTALVA